MKLLHVINIGHEAGGAERSVRLIQQGMTARGHQMRTVATTLDSEGHELFADDLVPAIQGSAPQRFLGYFWHRDAHRRLTRIMDEFQPDVVHLHTIGEFSPAALAATDRCPQILTLHGPEDWTLELLRWNLHSATRGERLSLPDQARYLYLRFLQRPAYLPRLRRLDRVLAPSAYFAEVVRRDVGRVPVHVLPNGVPRTAPPQPVKETGSLLYVGRLERVKGVHILLDAFRLLLDEHPGATLDIVGDGADRTALETSAADLTAAGRVRFRGWVSPDAVSEALAASSVVVVPSVWPENFPTVALEALQIGRALVASRVGGLPELVGEDNGMLVPAGDVPALAEALRPLVGDLERLRRLGDGSAARAARYDVERFLDALENHYRKAISR
ncbi:glycosyltransferase family 4 protein [Streptomyces sp. NBC_01669]|uniref:glycosyltransferase family 4 protein n=1 Tax=Streptomyces sp. NBC_01669 TaxID=2975909 RepID=UPI0022518EF6|nr:glycosyltransferase family 4 protein [Streptomyces sp. NBC_01669]MCX4538318.1 glycosyltransferase family 4 protein [Streptomyces sp. NBC_01669]